MDSEEAGQLALQVTRATLSRARVPRSSVAYDDLFSDVVLRVFDAAAAWDPKRNQSLMAWLFTSARWALADAQRRAFGRYGRRPAMVSLAWVEDRPSPEPGFERVEDADLAERLLATLPARHRQVVTSSVLHDRQLRDVGDEMGITDSRVCQMRTAAMRRMRWAASDAAAGG